MNESNADSRTRCDAGLGFPKTPGQGSIGLHRLRRAFPLACLFERIPMNLDKR